VLQSLKTAVSLIAQCGRLYADLALSAAELIPASLRRERTSESIALVAES
jgi:hypothetical protein